MTRRFFVPEVVQTSAMDCGPASLKALFGGFGIYLSYGRLREACQTDVDGTSIDALEDVGQKLGLAVSQSIISADFLLLEEAACLPAIVVVNLPTGETHFVVVWRVHGPFVQIMDPAVGRVWMDRQAFLRSLYIHQQEGPRAAWEEWSESAAFTAVLQQRLRAVGVEPRLWANRAHLDAALRLAQDLIKAGSLTPGKKTEEFLELCERNREQIPPDFWTARETQNPEQMLLRGAVLLKATGPCPKMHAESLPESLSAVLHEPPPRVWSPVWGAIQASGRLLPAMIGVALLGAGASTACEGLLFRGFLDLAHHLNLSGQRLTALALMIAFLGGVLALEWPASLGLLRLGRHLELRLRLHFLRKIPLLSDRYFQSRLISDMALRAHMLQVLRQLPELAGMCVRLGASLLFTVAGIAWLYRSAALPAMLMACLAVGIPLLFQPALIERDLRSREMTGALSRFYFDALRGVRAIQAHCAERTLRTAQAGQLEEWAKASFRHQNLFVRAEILQMVFTFGLTILMVYQQAARTENPVDLLLLVYWALSISFTGQQLASITWSLPALRNTLLRFMEPLGAQEETVAETVPARSPRGIHVVIEKASVVAGGQCILDDVSLDVAPGRHVGIIGLSGAGKSSLVGLLLGWHKPESGSVQIDGLPLDAARLFQLRRETAWIDPQVHLFNASLFENLVYGNGEEAAVHLDAVLENADLADVLEHLPNGMQASLGEGGALVSGGEGQRVRMGRALARPNVRLAILDEPARGLDRERRQKFLQRACHHFESATLFYITHDVTDTLNLDHVLVIEQGKILEQGSPHELCGKVGSRYSALVEQEEIVRRVWSDSTWRHLRLTEGLLKESPEGPQWMRD
jgi:ABC-type bacteriocin/lantibiotic exporter with double-glycine peptidase domain